MSRIVVVGIGADGMAGLSAQSLCQLRRATVIYGSRRQLDLLDDTLSAPRIQWPSPMLPALSALLDDADGDVHVMASGDPLLHGIGGTLIRLFGQGRVRVLPHVSCVTLACALLGWTAHDTEVISLVTAETHTAVRRGGRAVVLCRDAQTPVELAQLLTQHGRGDSEFSVLEALGGPGERRRDAIAREWAANPPTDVDDLSVVAVHYLPDERVALTAGLPDTAFEHDGQLTKQSARALTLSALAPRPGELLWDVGSGSGSIAVEWVRSGPGCAAIAFERESRRRVRIARNAKAHGVSIEVRGEAPDGFDGAPRPSVIFVGGGLTRPGLLDACLDALPVGGRLVGNAVTVESEAILAQSYSRIGGELRRFQHYRDGPLGGLTRWRPQLPITQWVVAKQ